MVLKAHRWKEKSFLDQEERGGRSESSVEIKGVETGVSGEALKEGKARPRGKKRTKPASRSGRAAPDTSIQRRRI